MLVGGGGGVVTENSRLNIIVASKDNTSAHL